MNGVWNTESILGGGLTGVKNLTVPSVAIQRADNLVSAQRSFENLAANSIDKLMAEEKRDSHRSGRCLSELVVSALSRSWSALYPVRGERPIPFVVSGLSRSW